MASIIIYTSDTCIRCKLVKGLLDSHGVKYTEATDKQIAIDKGLIEVPALEVDGKIIEGYGLVLTWLDENGYYTI